MRIKSITTGILAASMALGSIATAQDSNLSTSIEAKPTSWFNGSSVKLNVYHEANVDVEGTRATDIDPIIQPRFYQPIFNSALTLQVRTNISLRQDASIDAPVPEFILQKELSFLNEQVSVTPMIRVKTPLNGDTSGALATETFAIQNLEYDNLTVSPYVYNYSSVGFNGGKNVDGKIGKTTQGSGATGTPSVVFDKEPKKIAVGDQNFGFSSTTEIGTTIAPSATKGFSFDLAVELDGSRKSTYPMIDNKADEVTSKMVWKTSPLVRLTYKINDNFTFENDFKHSFEKFGGKSSQKNDFTNIAALKMTLY